MKPRCREEWEEGGGQHSWFVRCERADGHEGPCRDNLSIDAMVKEGTFERDPIQEVQGRRDRIEQLRAEIAQLEAEITEIQRSSLIDPPPGL